MTILRQILLLPAYLLPAAVLLRADVIYLGNGSQLQANAIATDKLGNVYVAGSTTDPTIAWATNVFHLEAPGSGTNDRNAFVLKLDPSGAPVYLTYLGGVGWESADGLAVDTNGSACVVGYTTSTNFPVVSALQADIAIGEGGAVDGFVVKLNPAGSALVFSTYFGGNGSDFCTDVKIDQAGSIVLVGSTTSTNLWTVNALQPTNASTGSAHGSGYAGGSPPSDAFVAKFHPSGTPLVYATYLGGQNDDAATTLALDEQGEAYVAGYSYSTNFPTQNAFHGFYSSNDYTSDAFLAKLSSNGQTFVFSTYLGGAGSDEPTCVAVDNFGSAYVAGTTGSPDFPLTNSVPAGSNTNGIAIGAVTYRSFLTKFSPNGSSLSFSTFLGGPGGDSTGGIALDPQGDLWIAGYQSALATSSSSFGFAASIRSNGLGVTSATKLIDCKPSLSTDVAVSPEGVWVLGTAFQENFDDARRLRLGTNFLVHLTGMVAVTNAAPLIQLARPADGGFWGTNTPIPLLAAATDILGNISGVEFFCDGLLIGAVTNPPYEIGWKAASLGIHTLQAVALDQLGARATSCPVHITVVAPPPNDEFEHCTPIFGLGVPVTGSIHGASRELGEVSVGSRLSPTSLEEASRTLWWCWLAPSNGAYTVSTEGTEFTEVIGLYTGYGLNDLTLVASQRYGSTGLLRQVTFRAAAGTIYFVSVAGNNEVAGKAVVQIRSANAPPNDDFENRILLTGLNATAAGANVEATRQAVVNPVGVISLSFSIGADVWWSWIAPVSGVFSVSTVGSTFQNQLGIYTGTNLASLASVSSAAWSASSLNPNGNLLTFSATAGTRYEIVVDSEYSSVGNIQLEIAPIPSPPNDLLANAYPLAGASVTAAGTTFGATAEPFEPSGATGVSLRHSVWWSWSPPASGTYRITATASNGRNPALSIYSGNSVSNLALVAGGEEDYFPPGNTAVWKGQAGVDYRLAIDSYYDAGGDVQLAIQPVTPPANDDFANRIPLTGAPVLLSGTTANATREAGEPNVAWNPPSATAWWSWTAPASSNYVLQLENAERYPLAQLFRGTDLTNLAPGSDVLYAGYGVKPRVPFNALAGETLQILVADSSSATGDFTLSIDFGVPPLIPVNDHFSNRIALIGADVEIQASNAGASIEPGEPGASCSIGTTVWWTWTAPSNAPFTFTTRTSGYGPGLSVYTGTTVSALTKQAGNTDGDVTFRAEAGTAYQIVVGECSMPGEDFSLRIRPAHGPVNDDFTNRIHLAGSYAPALGSNLDATGEPDEPSAAGQYGGPTQHTVWWSWTAPASGKTTVTASISDPPTGSTPPGMIPVQPTRHALVSVYAGPSLNALTRVSGQPLPYNNPVVFQADAGRTYHIQVDSGDTGNINLIVHAPTPPAAARFASAQPLNGGLQLEFIATPWRTHTLEFSPDLTNWFELSNTTAMLPQNLIWVPVGDEPARFFRLRSR